MVKTKNAKNYIFALTFEISSNNKYLMFKKRHLRSQNEQVVKVLIFAINNNLWFVKINPYLAKYSPSDLSVRYSAGIPSGNT